MWVTGWYEVYARSIVDGYQEMLKRGRDNQFLVAGPWTHANWDPYNGDANYGATAGVIPPNDLEFLDYELQWFNRWLKGDRSAQLGHPVKVFVMGGGDGRAGVPSPGQFENPKLMEPGKAYKFFIEVGVVSNVFLKGHKIRIEVSSSNFPRFDRNLNNGGKLGVDTEIVLAHQTIYHDAEHPSHILLPIIP